MNNILAICGILGGIISVSTLLGYSTKIFKYLRFLYIKNIIEKFFIKYDVAILKKTLIHFLKLKVSDLEHVDMALKVLYFEGVLYKITDEDAYLSKELLDSTDTLTGRYINTEKRYDAFISNPDRYLNKRT